MKKTLTEKEWFELYWDGWPYSETYLTFEQRFLDDKPAREFIVVSAIINPTTFKLCKKNKNVFKDDNLVNFILENAWYERSIKYYKIVTFKQQSSIPSSLEAAKITKKELEKAILRMHKFIMDNYQI